MSTYASLSIGNEDRAALVVVQDEEAVLGRKGVGDRLLHVVGRLVGVERQLTAGVGDADLDLHRGVLSVRWACWPDGRDPDPYSCRGKPRMPRQARLAMSSVASFCLRVASGMLSQNRAETWLIPTRATASSRETSGGKPVSSAMTSAQASAHWQGDAVDALADGRLARQVGLEHEPEGAVRRRRRTHRTPRWWPRPAPCCPGCWRAPRGPPRRPGRRRSRAARGRARACRGSAGRAPAWRRRPRSAMSSIAAAW